ncbi:hypothetical protein BD311DRAFT_517675 [Dichomitus squalens]|uniref:Uncharacterized protein n=1 Tax=Dichomitus squalens TaxID=114155 RepID=A0A4Q9MZS6_9APHY|nr:hypothetical protein BD311DRAFT_517675 [Dichomitus squalens]
MRNDGYLGPHFALCSCALPGIDILCCPKSFKQRMIDACGLDDVLFNVACLHIPILQAYDLSRRFFPASTLKLCRGNACLAFAVDILILSVKV